MSNLFTHVSPGGNQGHDGDIDACGETLQGGRDPATPNQMGERNSEVPNKENNCKEGPAEEAKDDAVQEIEMQERQTKCEQETLELVERQLQLDKQANRIQRQQATMVLDHLCDELLDVGSHEAPEHPFAAWLKAQNIKGHPDAVCDQS